MTTLSPEWYRMEGRYFYDMNMIYIVNEKQMGAEVFIGFYVYNLKDKVISSHQLFVIEAESRRPKNYKFCSRLYSNSCLSPPPDIMHLFVLGQRPTNTFGPEHFTKNALLVKGVLKVLTYEREWRIAMCRTLLRVYPVFFSVFVVLL